MNAMILATLPQQFQQLASKARQSEDHATELAALIERLGEAAGTGQDRRVNVEKVLGWLRMREAMLSTSEPAHPDKLADPGNQRERAFNADAIAHLTALIEAG